MTVKDRVRALCDERHITLYSLEMSCRFSKGYLSKLDTTSPSASSLIRIADYFGVSLDYLMCRTDYPWVTMSEPREEDYLTKKEMLILDAYRTASDEGQFNIIHACMTERDKTIEKGEERKKDAV